MSRALASLLLALACLPTPAWAHEVRPAYLELKQTGEETYDVLWKVPAAGDRMRLGLYVRFPGETVETSEHRGRFVGGAFVERWGVRRTSAAFWETMDWFHADFRERHPTEAGLFDLNRYQNL